jgi:hypothetical protein
MAGHVSKEMLKHYSHIRTEAKRRAVEALVSKSGSRERPPQFEAAKENSGTVPQDLPQVRPGDAEAQPGKAIKLLI